MVGISLQDDVRNSFVKVKDDILNLRRSVNRELLAIEEVSGRLQTFIVKDEFYSFVKRLGERLDKIDGNLEAYLGYEDEIKNVDAKVKSLGRKLSRQEDLGGEIKEIRKLKGKIGALEGSVVSAQKFNDEFGKVLSDVSSIKGAMLTGKALESLKGKLELTEKRIESLEKDVPSKDDFSGSLNVIDALRERVGKLESESLKKLEELEGSLRKEIENFKGNSVGSDVFEKSLRDSKKELASIRSILESSVSEIDFSDYATKKELGKKLTVLEEFDAKIEKVARNSSDVEKELESLGRTVASIEDVERIGSDVKSISKSLDILKGVIEKAGNSAQKRFEHELGQAKASFEKELSKVRTEFEDRLKRADRGKAAEKEGVLARLGRGFADFFKEEEDGQEKKEKKDKPVLSVSELLKEEEKKRPGKSTGFGRFFLVGGVVLVVLVASLFVFLSVKQPAGSVEISKSPNLSETTNDSKGELSAPAIPGTFEYCVQNYECKERDDGRYWFDCYIDERGTCRCFVTDAEGCGVVNKTSEKPLEWLPGRLNGKLAGYVISSGIFFVVFLAAYILILRNKGKVKKGKQEKGEENGVDLDEFFQKK